MARNNKKVALADRIYPRLHHEIVTLQLPPNTVVDEASVARRFRVSRTPVREAIRRLASDGFIELSPHRSPRVRPILIEGVRDYFEFVRILQKAVFILSAGRIGPAGLSKAVAAHRSIEAAWRRRDLMALPGLDVKFRHLIAEGTDSRHLIRCYDWMLASGMRLYSFALRHYAAADWNRELKESSRDHWAVIRALGRRDTTAIGPMSDRQIKRFQDRVWAALVRSDRQVVGGDVGAVATGHLHQAPTARRDSPGSRR